ncbi:MAG: ADP-ribosylation factor-like protein, partial [Promethearchaeota archaeon]
MEDIFARKSTQSIESHDYYKYKISYTASREHELLFLFVTGLTDSIDSIKKELLRCKREFLNLFSDILQHKFDAKTFEVFDPTIDTIHRNLRPKISLVGFSGVGKTTITKLIKAEEIPMKHVPTITGDIATIKIGKLYFHLWDFAGQEQFSYLWNNFVKGSDAVLLITDSTLENIEKSKFFLELIKEEAPQAHTAVIANKQDLPEALKPIQIEKIIALKTYSMIAKESQNRNKMIQIIADVLEMSAEVSPLLKPLLERDRLTEEAMNALENAEFSEASLLFEKISDLCIELGDDSLGREFYEKSEKIRQMLQKVGAPEQPPVVSEFKEPISKPPKVEAIPKIAEPISEPIEEEQEGKIEETRVKVMVEELPLEPQKQAPISKPLKAEPSSIFEELEELETKEEITEKPLIQHKPELSSTINQIGIVEKLEEELIEPEEKKPAKKKKEKKKKKKKKKKKRVEELEAHEVTSVIQQPSFLKKVEISQAAQKSKIIETTEPIKAVETPTKPLKSTESDLEWLHPKVKQLQQEKKFDKLAEVIKAEEEKIKLPKDHKGLPINIEEFMVKSLPKTVTSVPTDARTKLKTSAYGHVTNVPQDSAKEIIAPTEIKEPQKPIPKPVV